MPKLKGGDKLEQELAKLTARLKKNPSTLQVGFLENATYPDGTPVALIAAIQDSGAPKVKIPPRPFFRNMIARKKKDWPKSLANLLKNSGYDAMKALKLMGDGIKGQLQQSIRDTNSPPLKPSTLMRRGVHPGTKYDPSNPATFGAKPLIASSKMINSVDFRVVK